MGTKDELITEILREMLAYMKAMASSARGSAHERGTREREMRVEDLFDQLDALRDA